MPDETHDVVVIGGGIIGLATAMEFSRRFPRLGLALLEKEGRLASHQSGHNSGVIHTGIYYKPGSLKAQTCVAGAAAMVEFCRRHGIPHQICGKVIVATSEDEAVRLRDLQKRGETNGIPGLRLLCREELREIEPHCTGLQSLYVPGAGITDYARVCHKYADIIVRQGGQVRLRSEVTGLTQRNGEMVLETSLGSIGARHLINCAGLHSDRIIHMANRSPEAQIIPFRGEYYDLIPSRQHLVRALIYPVPDPRFPFLGVHFTRRINGSVDAGPNAVLALKREGYRKTDVSLRDTISQLSFPGFWRMVGKYWRTGCAEAYRSFSKRSFVKALQRLVPEVNASDMVDGGSGVRAQAVHRDGSLLDDFRFESSPNMVHVCNVPSPAATASIPIGQVIVRMAAQTFSLS